MSSEVPTLRAIIQQVLLIKERLVLEKGTAKTDIQASAIIVELVPLIRVQWHRSNAKFSPPVTEVVRGRAKKAEVKKVEDLLEKLRVITIQSYYVIRWIHSAKEAKTVW